MTTITTQPNKIKRYDTMAHQSAGGTQNHRLLQYSTMNVPNSLKPRAGFDATLAGTVDSEEKFDEFFHHAMTETRRGDLVAQYDRLSSTEKSMFVTAIASRGVLDKQKSRKRTKSDTFVEQGLRTQMISDMSDALRMGKDEIKSNIKADAAVYAKAARMMRSAQVSDKDDSLSKRDSYYDLKLVNRAFKFLAVVRDEANDADMKDALDPSKQVNDRIKGGYEDEQVINFHRDATLKEREAASQVTDMDSFAAFYKSLRKDGSKNIAKFEAYNEAQKQLFVYALANPSKIVKAVGPLRKSARHNDTARQTSKKIYANSGELNLQPRHYSHAAMTLLAKDGRFSKSKLAYNQPIVRDAMHFVRAAEMTQVDALRKKHERMAKGDDDLSGDTKWSATNSIDVARGGMRIAADKVDTIEDFQNFLVAGLERSGEKYAALAARFDSLDEWQKTIFIRGLSHRSTTEGHTDRSRLKVVRGLGNLVAASSVRNEQGRREFISNYIDDKQAAESGANANAPSRLQKEDFKRAAINLVSKDTQALLGDKNWFIDVGMVERGFQLVDDAEKNLRKKEAKDQNGYANKAHDLRRQFAEGSDEHKAEVGRKEYKAVSLATRQNVKDAGAVKDKLSFEAFFQSLMESDDNLGRWETYSQYADDEKAMFVRALAHRDIIDRERDHAILTRYLRLHDLHGYKGRETRDAYKDEFAKAGVSETNGTNTDEFKPPVADEYTAAAFSIISRESRRWNWLSKVTHRKTGDDRLIERAMKLVTVAGNKREEAQDTARNQFMKDNGMEGEITRRATREMKNSADAAKDLPTFGQFMAETVDKDRMGKYTALTTRDKELFVRALADRKILDHQSRKVRQDEVGRANLKINEVSNQPSRQMDAAMFKRAAYNVLSSKERALGKHRFLFIKSGAADNKLLDRAFRFLKETDSLRDEVTQPKDRKEVMQQYGVAKLTGQADSEKRAQADAVNSVETFQAFLDKRVQELGKEKYSYLFSSYNAEAKKVFISALASGNKAKRKETKKKEKPADEFLTAFDAAKSPRAAAYRLLSHRDGDVAAMHFAREMADDYINRDFAQKQEVAKAAGGPELSFADYRKQNGYTDVEMDEATEYEYVSDVSTEHQKASALRRKGNETLRNIERWDRDTSNKITDWVSNKVQNQDAGTFKRKAAKFFLYTMNPFVERMEQTSYDGLNRQAGGIKTKDAFMEQLHRYAASDKRISLYNSISKLSPDQFKLFIHALQNRDIIDRADEGDAAAYESRNQADREQLVEKYASGQLEELGEQSWSKAMLSMMSGRKTGKLGGLDQVETHSTILDWELVQDALAYVQFEAEDERALRQRAAADGREGEERERISAYGEDMSGGIIDKAMGLVGYGMTAKNAYGAGSEALEAYEQYKKGEFDYNGTVDTIKGLTKIKSMDEVKDMAKDVLGVDSLDIKSIMGQFGSIDSAIATVKKIQEHDVFKSLTEAGSSVMGLATSSKSLIQNSVEMVISSVDMHKLRGQSDTFDKQMMLRDKMDIVTDAIADAFDMAKEMQAKDINDKVFGILDAVCSLGTSAAGLAGVPIPLTKLIKNIWSLVSTGAKWVVGKVIELVNGDRLQKLLKTKERTHAYNQKVKAYNAQLGKDSKKKRDLLSEAQMQRLLLAQSGLKNENNARDYICRKTATCLVYAYGSKDPKNPERLAAAGLFANLKVPFKAGGQPPRVNDLASKLRGAH